VRPSVHFNAEFIGGRTDVYLDPGLRMPLALEAIDVDWDGFNRRLSWPRVGTGAST
jgi:hypothetical protein